ncbi:MAG: AmmeMemoRadiSam system protein B [Spirochaetales bacterium]|jgi:AmmeMemoRadiSam system protein B|nr:AmmeMemoRadiSam system protein B [Spirochaetales bacterium]
MADQDAKKTREALVDGLFYPDEAGALEAALGAYESECAQPRGKALAIVSPHAAYEKSGSLQAAAFLAASDRKIRRAVLVGPVHRDFVDAIILPGSEIFTVPSGSFGVEEKSVESLLSCGTHFIRSDIPHLEEHCLEVQLPFLGRYFPGVKIVPILLGKDSAANIKTLGKGLYLTFGKELSSTLFIITTNFCESRKSEKARAEAAEIIGLAEKKDGQTLMEKKLSKHFTACGVGCLAAFFLGFPGAGGVKLLGRAFSVSDAEADKRVEYAALAIGAS